MQWHAYITFSYGATCLYYMIAHIFYAFRDDLVISIFKEIVINCLKLLIFYMITFLLQLQLWPCINYFHRRDNWIHKIWSWHIIKYMVICLLKFFIWYITWTWIEGESSISVNIFIIIWVLFPPPPSHSAFFMKHKN